MTKFQNIIFIFLLLTMSAYSKKIYATFDVLAYKSANLAFSASGTVEKIMTDVSIMVKAGDTLATLNNDDLVAKYNIATIAMHHAKKDYERQLIAKNSIQQSKLDLYKFKYNNAQAEVNYIQSLLAKTNLKAPFDGIIAFRYIEAGDVVSAMAAKTAFILQSVRKRKLVLEFDQKYWKMVRTGDAFEYNIDGYEQTYSGVISKIYPKTNSKTRKMLAEVYASDFVVGLFGTGYIIVKDEESK